MSVHSDPDAGLQSSAEGTAEAGSLTVEQAIANVRQRNDLSLRYYAAWWLGKFRVSEPAAIDALLDALHDEADRAPDGGFPLRRNAARALGKLGDRRAVPALVDCLTCDDFYVREAAAQALETLGDVSAAPALVALLQSETGDASGLGLAQPYDSVLEALGTLGATSAIPVIQSFLNHPVPRVQYSAARAMYQLTQDASYGDRLVEALKGSDLQLRRSALMDLGSSGYVAAGPAIAQAFAENSLKLIALKELLDYQLRQDQGQSHQDEAAIVISDTSRHLLTLMDGLL
jgi:phycocyanobilin lyase alpha subunit